MTARSGMNARPQNGESLVKNIVEEVQSLRPSTRRARAPLMKLDQPGRLYVGNLMFMFQCSHQTVYARIATGVYPEPDGRDGRRPYWLTSTIRSLFEPALRPLADSSAAAADCRKTATRRITGS